jgi:hypothetical protein
LSNNFIIQQTPFYDKNKVVNLKPMMQIEQQKEGAYAITTFGMNNYGFKPEGCR